jgi:hypothetical protein
VTASESHPITGQPIGLPVEKTEAGPRPGPVTLKGRYGHLEKLRPEHWSDLWAVFAGHDQVWTYISTDGPFADASEFAPFIAKRAAAEDPFAYAIIDTQGRAVGYLTLLRINPPHRVIEVGHVLYSPSISWRVTCSRRSAIAATNGNAIHSTPRRGGPRSVMASSTKALSAST